MSYLYMPTGMPDLAKAVISFWFRVPQASVDACTATLTSSGLWSGKLPLVCLGPQGSSAGYSSGGSVIGGNWYLMLGEAGTFSQEDLGLTPYRMAIAGPPTADPTLPTFIGVLCKSSDDVTLFINLETNQQAAIENMDLVMTAYSPATTYAAANGVDAPDNIPGTATWSTLRGDETEHFSASNSIKITPDQWHHLLLSFSLEDVATHGSDDPDPPANIGSASHMWVALDDKNYTGDDLSDYWPGGSDENAMVTPNAYRVASSALQKGGMITYANSNPDAWGNFTYNAPPAGTPSFSLREPKIPNGAIGIPAAADFVKNIYQVELGEFQFFKDVTIDTGVEANRRAFIDYKRDAEGNPIADKDGNTALQPVPPKSGGPAELLLGKPDILLHGSQHWIKGKNTGSTGVDDNGNEIPDGQFQPVAGIVKYKPDPSLSQ
jgi:hypothetical protein